MSELRLRNCRDRIKRIARTRYLNYQSMMKQWLSERMEDEVK